MTSRSTPMKVGFAGSHEISWHCLKVIADLCRASGDEISVVMNLPAQAGAKHSAFVEFDDLESEYGFPQLKVTSLSAPEMLAHIRSFALDVLFIIGWHRIVPQEVIDSATYCLGVHASLLPKDRGSSPINWSILRGDEVGGLTLFHLSAGVDTGDMVGQKSWAIGPVDTCRDVYDKANIAAVDLLRENWIALREGRVARSPQDESLATQNPRRRPEDGRIAWSDDADRIDALVRAITHPYPGAFTTLDGKRLFIWRAQAGNSTARGEPGTVVSVGERITVATGRGALDISLLQIEGHPECAASVFSSTYQLAVGQRFG